LFYREQKRIVQRLVRSSDRHGRKKLEPQAWSSAAGPTSWPKIAAEPIRCHFDAGVVVADSTRSGCPSASVVNRKVAVEVPLQEYATLAFPARLHNQL
jgi:hypothetical protein